ncbi:hypothetical protein T02_3543 [Trichinella nativa]|uniref:Uncharacterized protein n=1 Tax=Trichinella nativa TaxID=6335 RepID=A0A0V1LKJ5_9BILA|nr:hypothetical protein T02_3543 [Trichinella nativa]
MRRIVVLVEESCCNALSPDLARFPIKTILTDCCLIVIMLYGKRESERKGNPPVNTGPSPFSDECANSAVEEVNEPARGSGSLRYLSVAPGGRRKPMIRRNTADVELRSSLLKPHLGLGSPERRKLQ